ncbi:MAG: hypothetical protein ACOCW8_00645 [bacterium]
MKHFIKHGFIFILISLLNFSCTENDLYYKNPVEPNLEVQLSTDVIENRGTFEVYLSSDLRLEDGDHYDVLFNDNIFPVRRKPTSVTEMNQRTTDTLEIGSRYTRNEGDFNIIVKAISYGTDEIIVETDSSMVITINP